MYLTYFSFVEVLAGGYVNDFKDFDGMLFGVDEGLDRIWHASELLYSI